MTNSIIPNATEYTAFLISFDEAVTDIICEKTTFGFWNANPITFRKKVGMFLTATTILTVSIQKYETLAVKNVGKSREMIWKLGITMGRNEFRGGFHKIATSHRTLG